MSSFKFLVIFITLSSITQADRSLTKDQVDAECAFRNSFCNLNLKRPCCHIRDVCMPSGPENLFRCTEKVGLGKFCYRNDECDEIHHAKCSKDNKCVCRAKNVQISEMSCGPLLGGFCWKNESCLTNNAVCIDNECKCRDNFSLRSNDQCIFDTLGAHCENDILCQEVRFAKCSQNNTCQCSSNTVAVNPTYCAAVIGGFCWTKDDCLPLNSDCIDNKCQCDNLHTADSNEKCTLAHIGMACDKNSECSRLIPFTKCSKLKKCICKENYFEHNLTACYPSTRSSEYCIDTSVPCRKNNFVCINYHCQCKPNFVYKNSKCFPDRLYESCNSTFECHNIEHATCSDDNICVCDKNYAAWDEKFCRPVLGGICSKDKDCYAINSVCIDKKCQCKELFFKVSENLCLSQRLGENCTYQHDCAAIRNAECTENNVCECLPGYGQYNITTCGLLLGGDCSRNELCAPVNSVCINNICLCGEGHLSESNDKCVSNQLAKQCEVDDHCKAVLDSKCVNNFCVCNQHHVLIDGSTCAPLLNEHCEEHQQCAPENSICVDHKCKCKDDYKKHFNYKCISTLGHFKISCDRDDHCADIKYAECSNDNKCACKSDYVPLGDDKCVALLVGLGINCRYDDDCRAIENSKCSEKKICECIENSVKINSTVCFPIFGNFGISCTSDYYCINYKYAECSYEKKCACKSNYVALGDDQCVALIGEYCDSDSECISYNTVCVDHKCECPKKFVMRSKYQCDRISLGKTCKQDYDCQIAMNNSLCSKDKVCVCKENHYALNNYECVPYLYEKCTTDYDCHFNFSACIDNQCQCTVLYRSVSFNRCELFGSLYSCEKNIDCGDPWHNICSKDRKCICNNNNTYIDKSTCSPLLGGYCWTDHQCVVRNSICVDFHCKCRGDFRPISSNMCMPVKP
ncbi:GSCOCG00002455001-RA-CDS [Cotesia congregata]|nr:GSCOCG00002455001-RA-CDS [Cotesia congregata]